MSRQRFTSNYDEKLGVARSGTIVDSSETNMGLSIFLGPVLGIGPAIVLGFVLGHFYGEDLGGLLGLLLGFLLGILAMFRWMNEGFDWHEERFVWDRPEWEND
jgi:hypothetical protein